MSREVKEWSGVLALIGIFYILVSGIYTYSTRFARLEDEIAALKANLASKNAQSPVQPQVKPKEKMKIADSRR